mgnify:CR=1 FL=1
MQELTRSVSNKAVKQATFYLLVMVNSFACTVPGSNIDSGAYQEEAAWFEEDGGVWFPGFGRGDEQAEADVASAVDIVPITPNLLIEQPMLTQATIPNAVAAAAPIELSDELANYEYRVAPGDILNIIVYEHPELTIPAGSQRTAEESGIIVENDGTLFYPYVGIVNVDGLTVNQIRDIIADDLAEFINDPQVDVKVVVYNSKRVFVTGQVNTPGPQRITNVPLTILDAIANAGGLTENANWHEVLLSRNGVETELSVYEMLNNGRLGQNRLLQHGDVLHVPDTGLQEVYVLGELNEVSILPMGNIRISLTEAVTMAQGLNQDTSNAKGLFVIRPNSGENGRVATLYQLNVQNAVSFALGSRFMLQPQDIVYVTTAPVSRWNRVISQILPGSVVNALLVLERLAD